MDLSGIKYYWFTDGEVAGTPARIAHTGYTGEDGFEIYVPPADAERMWKLVMDAGAEFGIKPCGLGARNTLRLEAKMALYGHEIDASISPLEADLGLDRQTRQGRVRRDAMRCSNRRRAAYGASLSGSKCALAGSAAMATKSCSMALPRAGSPAADRRHAEQEHRIVLPSGGAIRSRNQHSNHDPQPARGCGDSGNSVL